MFQDFRRDYVQNILSLFVVEWGAVRLPASVRQEFPQESKLDVFRSFFLDFFDRRVEVDR